jgi:adenine-specific DNA-methyltransferase
MPTLHWIGKEKVINHHLAVPFRVLEHKYGFDNGNLGSKETNSGNKIIHGDNLEALKALLPEYEGRIKCIYIDPPYNTGNETWRYNDNVNDPKIKKWLHEVVGKEGEDLSRHDKWLCMMYPRLKLLHKLLSDDGAIFISIDDNEQANLRLIMDEIFGIRNFIGKVSWFKKRKGSYLSKEFVSLTEYIFAYRKDKKLQLFGGTPNSEESQPLVKRTNAIGTLTFPANSISTKLKDGIYPAGLYGKGTSAVTLLEDAEIKNSKFTYDIIIKAPFIWSQAFLLDELKKDTEIVINTINFQPRAFRKSDDKHKGFPSYLDGREFSATTDDAYETLKEIFETDRVFDYSKPFQLIEYLIASITHFDKNAIVLDSFAGSGTTSHAVLNLNKKDGGNRKFILIEMENYVETITAERVKRVMNGYSDTEGTGGSFDFYLLGQPLFTEGGTLNDLAGIEKMRRYIFYTETQTFLNGNHYEDNPYLLGLFNNTAYYFQYDAEGTTTLNHDFLSTIRTKAEQYIIYADNCLLPKEFMSKRNISFKKIPRDITLF